MNKTCMIDKSNFDEKQYRADLDSAYECGRASVLSVIEDIKAEIREIEMEGPIDDRARFIRGGEEVRNLVLRIIDRNISGKEKFEPYEYAEYDPDYPHK